MVGPDRLMEIMQRFEARSRAGGAQMFEHINDDVAVDLRQQLVTRVADDMKCDGSTRRPFSSMIRSSIS